MTLRAVGLDAVMATGVSPSNVLGLTDGFEVARLGAECDAAAVIHLRESVKGKTVLQCVSESMSQDGFAVNPDLPITTLDNGSLPNQAGSTNRSTGPVNDDGRRSRHGAPV